MERQGKWVKGIRKKVKYISHRKRLVWKDKMYVNGNERRYYVVTGWRYL